MVSAYEKLRRATCDILKVCIGFLRHSHFQFPREENRIKLITAIISKRSLLLEKSRNAVSTMDLLLHANYFASHPQQRVILRSANDGLIWYTLKRVVANRLMPGSSERDRAAQQACIALLDEMCTMCATVNT